MRFAIIAPEVCLHHGQGRVNLEIAIEADRQGHEVVVIAERVSGLPPAVQERAIVLAPPAWLPSRVLRDQLFAWRTTRALSRNRLGCDAVLANSFVTWKRSDVNAVHFVHASWLRSPQHPWRTTRTPRGLYATIHTILGVRLERLAFRRTGRLVAVSPSVRDELGRERFPDERISVVLNGVDTGEFHPGPRDPASFGLPAGVKLALFAGDLKTPRKNLETVLRALTGVVGLHLAIAGREEGTPYPGLVKSLGLEQRVHFLGFRQDMPALMRSMDLFVFPSRYEPCGLVLLEALASGVPVVTSRSVGIAELLDPAVGMVLDDCNDVEGLAEALRTLVADETRRLTMGREARSLAERYSWTAMARDYIDLMVSAARKNAAYV